jgi:hypothetical protein
MRPLETCPQLDEAVIRWNHFWKQELYKRPVVIMGFLKEDVSLEAVSPISERRYYDAVNGNWDNMVSVFYRYLHQMEFPGDGIPMWSPDCGPDQWAAFFGKGKFRFSEYSNFTNWIDTEINDWAESLPLRIKPGNEALINIIKYAEFLAQKGEGQFLVGQIDAHSNADALSALRGTERFLMDLYDCPYMIEKAMNDVRSSYVPVHEKIMKAGKMGGERGYGHYGFWSDQPFQVIQSDVICMLGEEHFKKFVYPALLEEFSYWPTAFMHLDGPGALRHLDTILSIPGYWILQWQPGSGQKPNWQWTEVFQKAQAAGKAVHVFGEGLTLDVIKKLSRELDPVRTVYCPYPVNSKTEAMSILDWLEKNT